MSGQRLIALKLGTLFAGRFRVISKLAHGGMGGVYHVEQLSNGAQRALKVLHPSVVNDDSVRAGFEREARVGSTIASDHIVEVIDAGVDADTDMPWIAMELLQGETLKDRVRRYGRFEPAEIADVFAQIGDGLGAAHDAHVVHLDMKPQNVFLAEIALHNVRGPVVKLLDFGIARVIAMGATSVQITSVSGSPFWMAPEQIEASGRARPSSDVWSLGLIAYMLFTGKIFWRAAATKPMNVKTLLSEILVHPIPRATERAIEHGVPGVFPPDFDVWFSHCVERDHSARFQNARAATTAFRHLLVPR